ncbi:monovalent cation/H(+) antiporter subunit G [bacterium]|nr:monovalent cation/H(+) antiporter subunit G [bacterium]
MTAVIGLCALLLGIAITAAGVVGIYRFPDVYARLNALAKVTTMGAVLVHLSSGALLPPGHGGKGVLTALVLLLTTPAVTQAIAYLSHRQGLPNCLERDELADERASSEP